MVSVNYLMIISGELSDAIKQSILKELKEERAEKVCISYLMIGFLNLVLLVHVSMFFINRAN